MYFIYVCIYVYICNICVLHKTYIDNKIFKIYIYYTYILLNIPVVLKSGWSSEQHGKLYRHSEPLFICSFNHSGIGHRTLHVSKALLVTVIISQLSKHSHKQYLSNNV